MRRPRIRSFAGKQVFVTGAASGIGRATALAAAEDGARVHLTDISPDALTATAAEIRALGGDVGLVEAADISDEAAVRALAGRLTDQYGPMDVIMNVAGIARWGTISAMSHDSWRRVIDVNLMGPIHVLEHLVPPMVDGRRGGHIVNVSSAAGIIALPWHGAYAASKFGLRGISEVLRFDLRKHGIGVSLVCPGGVDTGLTQTVDIAGVDRESPRFAKALGGFRKHAVSPESAAESILEGVRRNKYWVYTSRDIWAAHLLQRYFPPGYTLAMRTLNFGANRVLPDVEKARK